MADPPYLRIVTELRHRITTGKLRVGERVPSTRQITQDWGVAMATATKVLAALQQEGLVRAVPGVGTVVDGRQSAPRPPRLREPGDGLTQDRIVRTAIEIADAEGSAALSMRRVAAELGVATMSIYRHVRGKDELLLAMIDMAIGERRLPEAPPVGWRAMLELSSRLQWDGFRRHPWLAQAISISRPQPTPNGMAHTEWALRALDGLGLDQPTMLYVHLTVFNFVRGTAVHLEAEAEAERDTGLNADEWMESQDTIYNTIMAAGTFPMLSGFAVQEGFELDLDLLFEFGLRSVLDGIGALIDGTTGE